MSTNTRDPHVVIIVLNWNGLQDTLACLDSLSRITYSACEIIVVDNGSTDGSQAALKAAYPGLNLLETGQNLGFVGGNNLGLEYARKMNADYALLLNNDTEVSPDFLCYMVQTAEANANTGIIGPAIYYYDKPDTFWSAGGNIDWSRGATSMIGLNEVDHGQFGQSPLPVDFVTGCALLIKMSVVERAGVLDPRFFAYYEETEWCVRVHRCGYNILLTPQAKIWHKISLVAREASPTVHYYMTRNRLLFLKLTQASLRSMLKTLLEYLRTLVSWTIKPRWRGKAPQRRAMMQAISDFSRGRFGKVELAGRA